MARKRARLLRAGDIIPTDDGPQVVRDVVVVCRLANGQSVSIPAGEGTETVPPEDLSGLQDEIEALQSEEEASK